ncbi:LuxR family transcriptional regulator [Streptomyces sp. MNU76]|uniref:ATP-binding protein n=1 Tax=Streptomyces sp. MNU76 TaxID=2560026 RepID=UPI001E401EA3|nr:LuxR family transcriptional regulator [Streptomyces sp. MNU76]MCC9710285.1 LuxR family transcriptional regulator [Streptomyces sp. MNU76]
MTEVAPDTGNLPAALASFVGRRREIANIRRLLSAGRVVTLTGVGGVGKTRLALAVAEASRKAFPGGVWLVDLAAVRDPAAVTATAAGVLRVPDRGPGPALARLTDHLARRRALIVLDNCEHLIEASAELAKALATACPDLRLLATSRETLDIAGEHVFTVPPLSVADDAVHLLTDRATALRPDFCLTAASRTEAVRLCSVLDGLPLAVELAASRLRTLSVEQLLGRLEDRFALLTGGCRTTLPRQRTLRGMIEWSYELCAPSERLLWERLSIFSGSFTLDAAEEVCAGDGLPAHEVVMLLDRLVAQSVVLMTKDDGPSRYRLLETIREYGRMRLAASGEHPRLSRRHRDFYLDRAERSADRWLGPDQQDILAWQRAEHANLVAALECPSTDATDVSDASDAADASDGQAGLRLAVALRFHWCADGFLAEGRRQLDRLLAADSRPTPVRARALWCSAWVALLQGDFTGAEERLDLAQDLCGRLAAPSVEADGQGLRGTLASFRREAGALDLFDAALATHRLTGDGPEQLFWLFQKAIVQVRLGHPDALDTSARAVEIAERHGEQLYRSYALSALGFALWAHGDEEGALARTRSALEILQGFNDYAGTVMALGVPVQSAVIRGEHERAAVLLGAVRALYRATGMCTSTLGPRHKQCEETVAGALGTAKYEKALARGGDYDSPARVIAFALGTTATTAAMMVMLSGPNFDGSEPSSITVPKPKAVLLIAPPRSQQDSRPRSRPSTTRLSNCSWASFTCSHSVRWRSPVPTAAYMRKAVTKEARRGTSTVAVVSRSAAWEGIRRRARVAAPAMNPAARPPRAPASPPTTATPPTRPGSRPGRSARP